MEEKKIRAMIYDDFECLKGDIDSLIDYFKELAKKNIDDGYHEGMLQASDKWKSVERFKAKINEILDEFDSLFIEEIEDVEKVPLESSENNDFVGMRNFTFTDPLQIKLFNEYFDVNRNWREVLITVCEELIKRQPEKFKSFDSNSAFKGRKRVYFSYKPEDLSKACRKLSNGLFVELNLSATDIAQRCCDILEQCGYSTEEIKFKVEWKEQLTNEKKIINNPMNDTEIKLSPKYSSIHITKKLFSTIIDEIINSTKGKTNFFNPKLISDRLNEVIISQSTYVVSYHVVNKIVNYLIDCNLIEKIEKGKYVIKDENLLKNWVYNV